MKLIRENCCCFTGHRAIPEDVEPWLRLRVRQEIIRLAGEGIDTFLAGGALGFDTVAAQAVLQVRARELPHVRLGLVLPCLGQESKWSPADAAAYHELIRQADEAIYTGDLYTRGCMFVRNRYLVDHSSRCVCYLTAEGKGGTDYTVKYARKQGLPVINLAASAENQTSLFSENAPK